MDAKIRIRLDETGQKSALATGLPAEAEQDQERIEADLSARFAAISSDVLEVLGPEKIQYFLLGENGMRKVSSAEHFAKLAATQAAAA